jgi:serine/threonine protein kinase
MNRCLHCFSGLHEIAVFCQHCGGLHEPALDQLISQTIANRFRINRRLSQGEHSTLFAATDLQNDETVVIKVSNPANLIRLRLSNSINGDQLRHYWLEIIERMRIETEALMKIRHPNIVRFYGTGVINDDIRYTVMECLQGISLREVIARKKRIPLANAIEVVFDVSSALRQVHAHGIAHRDLIPGNIFLYRVNNLNRSHLTVKLTGFGIAKLSPLPSMPSFARDSFLTGAITYEPPEKYENHVLDHRTDIFSLGVVIYEMLTRKHPFKAPKRDQRGFNNLQAAPTPPSQLNPDAPPEIDKPILRALAWNPDDRQQSVDELREQLLTASVPPIFFPICVNPEPVNRSKKSRYRMRRIATVIAIASIAIICGRIFLHDRLLNFLSTYYKKTVISTALPSPSPSSTARPIVAINDGGIPTALPSPSPSTALPSPSPSPALPSPSPSTALPSPSPSPAGRIAKPGVQTDTLPSGKNVIGTQAERPERKADKEPQSMRPRMLQWSGTVSRERVVKIDMPGVPVKVQISQASGCDVEIIEPPTAANNWRHVTLRILGQGDVSFRLGWRPISRS